ncbi:hypothetical protein DH2020_028895 [Rehmannia glutinosa]|uniref:Glycoside hydrolase family 5 domain-containing protein n=1 Tax=Rehmannia glutinosa TaxID=99300 RepID=A0ABR0VQ42_REHGL
MEGRRMTINKAIIPLFLFLQFSAFCNSVPQLSTNSRFIVDGTKRVKLACVNWVSHLQPMIAEGLEKKPLNHIATKIAETGFNCVRFTWATFMFTRPDYYNLKVSDSLDKYNLTAAKTGIAKNNPGILRMRILELHKAVVDELGRNNLMVVLDNHVSRPDWCCGDDDGNGFFGMLISTRPNGYRVVGMSMRNELRGKRQNETEWYKYMQEGATTIHKESPDFLVIISGLSYDTNLGFLRTKPLPLNLNNKLVYEAHWYTFGISADRWTAQTNNLCAVVAEKDIDWALWTFQGSYMLRQGTVNLEEFFGVMDVNWDRPRNPGYLDRLQVIRQMNQDLKSNHPTYNIIFHPQSGQCLQIGKANNVFLANCKTASRWDQHQDGGPIKLAGSTRCLTVAGDGGAACVSNDCSSNRSKWKFVSSSGLQLGAQNGQGKYLCLEKNNSNSTVIVTKKCLCVGDNLDDLATCAENPIVQWFKLVPVNV